MDVNHFLDMAAGDVLKILRLKRVEKVTARLYKPFEVGFTHAFDIMRKRRGTFDFPSGMYNHALDLHASIMFVEPCA